MSVVSWLFFGCMGTTEKQLDNRKTTEKQLSNNHIIYIILLIIKYIQECINVGCQIVVKWLSSELIFNIQNLRYNQPSIGHNQIHTLDCR